MALIGAVGIDLEGEPDVRDGIGLKGLAEDAEDGVRLIAEGERGADDFGIAAEFTLPESVTDNDNVTAVGGIFLGREGAAEHDGRAKEAEVRLGGVDTVDLLGNGAGEIEAGTAEVVGGDVLKDAGLGTPVVEFGGRRAGPVTVRGDVHELDHAVGVGIGEGLQQHGVDDGKDGGVGSAAEGERGDGGDGERRVGDEDAEGVAEVLPEVIHELCRFRTGELRPRGNRAVSGQSTVRLGRTASRCDGW